PLFTLVPFLLKSSLFVVVDQTLWNCKTPPKIEYASVPSIYIIPTLSLPLSILSRNLEILVLSDPARLNIYQKLRP
ncbi:hypothetical protein NAI31_10545, partial [Francisella tularensis subsp. holarctica]|uniref:hypothetical protein n=1 Tax=Francisella tularensis TaxID=263 RepID=UPI00238195E1